MGLVLPISAFDHELEPPWPVVGHQHRGKLLHQGLDVSVPFEQVPEQMAQVLCD